MLAPAVTLATVGVLITTLLTAPVAKLVLGIGWMQALLVGAVVASTDAAAVFFLINARGLRLRPRVRATLEVESGTNDPFAVFLTVAAGRVPAGRRPELVACAGDLRCAIRVLGCIIGCAGGRVIMLVLNRLDLPQGLHAPFVAVERAGGVRLRQCGARAPASSRSISPASWSATGRPARTIPSSSSSTPSTWLAQIVMFVLLGLLVWPQRLADSAVSAPSWSRWC